MPGYFSFQKLITPRFVKFIYVVGLIAITATGIGLAGWAGNGLRSATMATRTGWYYIALGAGLLILGNLVWRVLCEIWIVLFNIHDLLGSIARETPVERVWSREEPAVELERAVPQLEREATVSGHPASVLGLT